MDAGEAGCVFLAAGGMPAVPEIPGIERSNVVSGAELHQKLKLFSRFIDPYSLRKLSKIPCPSARGSW